MYLVDKSVLNESPMQLWILGNNLMIILELCIKSLPYFNNHYWYVYFFLVAQLWTTGYSNTIVGYIFCQYLLMFVAYCVYCIV